MDKISNFPLKNYSTRKQKSPLVSRYKLLHAEKINRRPEGGGYRSMPTPLNTPLAVGLQAYPTCGCHILTSDINNNNSLFSRLFTQAYKYRSFVQCVHALSMIDDSPCLQIQRRPHSAILIDCRGTIIMMSVEQRSFLRRVSIEIYRPSIYYINALTTRQDSIAVCEALDYRPIQKPRCVIILVAKSASADCPEQPYIAPASHVAYISK